MVWLCSAGTRANNTARIRLQLQDDEILEGERHPDWGTQGNGVPMLCVLDLPNAYKQLPLHPSCRKYSIVTLLNPQTLEPACFEGKVLPFGSTASVVHFNRCSIGFCNASAGASLFLGEITSTIFQFYNCLE